MKMASILEALRRRDKFEYQLIHTGQHYSPEMSDSFFEELQIPAPDINLGVRGGTQTAQIASTMSLLEPVFANMRPDLVLVVGDVNSTVAAALAGAHQGIQIAHVEAGLRSFDRRMPEELNRVVTDSISNYLFASESSGVENLVHEGVPQDRIFFVGNVMIDTLLRFRAVADQSQILAQLRLQDRGYAVVTLHRPSNVDDPERLKDLINMLTELSRHIPVVFPMHPRTKSRLDTMALDTGDLILTGPMGYIDFIRLVSGARLTLTDSGGVQEETTILQVPCLTLRENTERPATVKFGTNRLAGLDPARILEMALETVELAAPPDRTPELWDGCASARILDVLERVLEGR
jgi:UDP-N-acetylglucosamine 2-epimerase (non-hydrolysing)